jgi:hypothetical protein
MVSGKTHQPKCYHNDAAEYIERLYSSYILRQGIAVNSYYVVVW